MTEKEYLAGLNKVEIEIVNFIRHFCGLYKPNYILEVGSGWGVSARAFLQYSDASLWTVDKIPTLSEFDMRTAGYENRIYRMTGSSHDVLKTLKVGFDMAYVDASHIREDVKEDLYDTLRLMNKDGIILMDDVDHPKNDTGEYGVRKALVEFVNETDMKNWASYPIGNGMGVIYL